MVASQVGTGRRGERVGLLGTSGGAMGWPELDEGWDNPIVSWLGGTNQRMGDSSWVRWREGAVCALCAERIGGPMWVGGALTAGMERRGRARAARIYPHK